MISQSKIFPLTRMTLSSVSRHLLIKETISEEFFQQYESEDIIIEIIEIECFFERQLDFGEFESCESEYHRR